MWRSFIVLGVLACACARTVPARPAAESLYRDLQRLVTVSEAAEWKIDRTEVESLLPDALLSLCATDEDSRDEVARFLAARRRDLGGDPRVAWSQRGRDRDRIADLLEVARIEMVLAAARDAAERDCPFWVEPRSDFAGRQISDDRWMLSVGGGGRGNLLLQGDRRDVSFGGAGRLLFGRAFGDRWAFFTGGEAGGSAAFPRDDEGERASVAFDLELAVPVVARWRMVNSYVELEGAYLVTFAEDDLETDHGFRVGAAIGARALLTRWFFPGAAFQINYDRIGAGSGGDGESARHTLRIGVRVAFDLNL